MSAAAYKALWQLITKPFYWEKTEHGVAQQAPPRTAVLSRHLQKMGALALAVLLCLAAANTALANPWARPSGQGEVLVTASGGHFTDIGKDDQTVTRRSASVRAEYCATDDVTVTLDAAYSTDFKSGRLGQGQVDEAQLGLRIPIVCWEDGVASVAVRAGGEKVYGAPAQDAGLWSMGDVRLAVGQSFFLFGHHGFVTAEPGWRRRAGPPADEVLLDTTLGLDTDADGFAMLQSFSIISAGAAQAPYHSYSLHKVELSAVRDLGAGFRLQIGVVTTLAAKNTAYETQAVAALWWRFDAP
jgi:hypothetical protein